MLSVFSSPSRYTQGKNATAELGKEMKALGLEGPALIIAGRSALGMCFQPSIPCRAPSGVSYR